MQYLFMLEDDLDRIRRFRAVVALNFPNAKLDIYRTAPSFISAYANLLTTPCLVCLDHDLFVDSPNDPDPGDGRDVTDYLASRPDKYPTLIHSTNGPAADSMMFSLREARWTVDRISPIGDDWIETFWFPTAREMAARGNDEESEGRAIS